MHDDTYQERFCGVVVKGPTDGFVSVAHAGRVEVIAGSSIQSGRFAETYGAAGKINDNTAGTSTCIGMCLESGSTNDLVWIALQTIELA